jgi:hypothetical protein
VRDVVGLGEVDLLVALPGDRHRREDQVRRALLEERDAIVGDRLDELGSDPERPADRLPEVDVEALDLAGPRILEAERGHVVLDADRDLALLLQARHRGARGELLRLGRLAGAATAACHRERQRGRQ